MTPDRPHLRAPRDDRRRVGHRPDRL